MIHENYSRMKIKSTIFVLLLLQSNLFAQKEYVADSLKVGITDRKLNGFLCLITDVTINERMLFTSVGMGGAFLFADKYYIGGYGIGLISPNVQSNVIIDNINSDYQLNYAHGGIWLGIIESPCKRIETSFSLKIGWGALFLHNINSFIDYNKARREFFVITPQFETGILITNWLKINLGIGVRFLSGISTLSKSSNGNTAKLYNLSDFEGYTVSFTLNFGSFCNNSAFK